MLGFSYDNANYYYRKNAFGDIVAILNSNGEIVVEYDYDAWGNATCQDISTNNLGAINPFRYRGYYFDVETGLYYLNTRYYDSETGRFITIDDVAYLNPDVINGINLYAYCGNNPVMNVDPNGTDWNSFWKGVGNWFVNTGKKIVEETKKAVKTLAISVKPVVDLIQVVGNNIDYAYSTGISTSGTVNHVKIGAQAGITVDSKGNVGFQFSTSEGLSNNKLSGGIGSYYSISNVETIKNLEGAGAQIGGSYATIVEGVPVSVGAEWDIIPKNNSGMYDGITISAGLGTPGTELYASKSNTITLFSFNMYEVFNNLFNWVMEW